MRSPCTGGKIDGEMGVMDKWAVLHSKPLTLTISGHAILHYLIIRSFRIHTGKTIK